MRTQSTRKVSTLVRMRVENVIPSYMGLISELDANIGRLIKFLENEGKIDDTIIVLTSDHGDYLGDHWLGEKR